MSKERYLFTSESVTEGHPDKIADAISDAILDEILRQDLQARVACEVMVSTGLVFVAGEITTSAKVEYPEVVRKTVSDIGYNRPELGFDASTCAVMISIDKQSPDIAQGVSQSLEAKRGISRNSYDEIGAGDSGMVVGYACRETDVLMPMPIYLAHRLSLALTNARKSKIAPFLRPDGKTQVTIEYRGGRPARVHTIIIAAQHDPDVTQEEVESFIKREVIEKVIPHELLDKETIILINPTGRFVVGGPVADVGLTGRKIIQDTYGGKGTHGGGCFSGKDPTKVDRSGAYMARYIAKNVVAANLADEFEIQISYAIGLARPVSVFTTSYGTAKVKEDVLHKAILAAFDLRPKAIIEGLDLLRPIYQKTSAYGHFGREDVLFPWERMDKIEVLLQEVKNAAS